MASDIKTILINPKNTDGINREMLRLAFAETLNHVRFGNRYIYNLFLVNMTITVLMLPKNFLKMVSAYHQGQYCQTRINLEYKLLCKNYLGFKQLGLSV
jgi:hypothetical protein